MAEYLTPLQEQQGVSDDKTFVDEVGAFLEKVEGKKPLPYLDDKGIPTVGIGINLNVFPVAYLNEFGIISTSKEGQALSSIFKKTYTKIIGHDQHGKPIYGPDEAAFQEVLAIAMKPYGAVSDLTLSNAKIEHLYDSVVLGDSSGNDPNGKPAMLTQFKQFLKDNNISSDLLTSREGLAIFSLYYNSQKKLLPTTGHLVPDLKETSDGGFTNRADAWFQIRYNSNAGALTVDDPSGGQNGTAIRRDMESTILGLYNAGDVAANGTVTAPLDESLAVYAELSQNTNGTHPKADGTESNLAKQLGTSNNELMGAI